MLRHSTDRFASKALPPLLAIADNETNVAALVFRLDGAELNVADVFAAIPLVEHSKQENRGIVIAMVNKAQQISAGERPASGFRVSQNHRVVHPDQIRPVGMLDLQRFEQQLWRFNWGRSNHGRIFSEA